jgi:hypothetical protein
VHANWLTGYVGSPVGRCNNSPSRRHPVPVLPRLTPTHPRAAQPWARWIWARPSSGMWGPPAPGAAGLGSDILCPASGPCVAELGVCRQRLVGPFRRHSAPVSLVLCCCGRCSGSPRPASTLFVHNPSVSVPVQCLSTDSGWVMSQNLPKMRHMPSGIVPERARGFVFGWVMHEERDRHRHSVRGDYPYPVILPILLPRRPVPMSKFGLKRRIWRACGDVGSMLARSVPDFLPTLIHRRHWAFGTHGYGQSRPQAPPTSASSPSLWETASSINPIRYGSFRSRPLALLRILPATSSDVGLHTIVRSAHGVRRSRGPQSLRGRLVCSQRSFLRFPSPTGLPACPMGEWFVRKCVSSAPVTHGGAQSIRFHNSHPGDNRGQRSPLSRIPRTSSIMTNGEER